MSDPHTPTQEKVGIISCSGEEIPEGTISRLATIRTLGVLRPNMGVTLCLPLFIAGDEGLRNFARAHPTITVDGCDKRCARWATEKYSGPVARSLVVSDMLGDREAACRRSSRSPGPEDAEAVRIVSQQVAAAVDEVLRERRGETGGEAGR